MASTASPSLPHRSVSTIRGGGAGGGGGGGGSGSGGGSGRPEPTTPGGGSSSKPNPHTPTMRTTPSAFASPSSVRADEETIVLELGARQLRIGLAGDPIYRGTVTFGPEQQRRVGDLRVWQDAYRRDWRAADEEERSSGSGSDSDSTAWDAAYELWQLDVRHVDLGLVSDKLERALREAFTKYLLIDSRPRRVVLVLPPALPIPLLATTLDTLFRRFQSPSIALLSVPVAAAAAAGLRNALVVDLGWTETVVTSVYEYREVACTRSVRAGRMLIQHVHDLLAGALSRNADDPSLTQGRPRPRPRRHHISFEECEGVAARVVWCRPAVQKAKAEVSATTASKKTEADPAARPYGGGLATVAEMDESDEADETDNAEEDSDAATAARDAAASTSARTTDVPLRSCTPPQTVCLSFDQLAEPCESTFFGGSRTSAAATSDPPANDPDSPASWDDHELPVPLLIYRHLLRLPVDVRAVCMARLVFVGGATHVLGLRARIFDEVARLVAEQGWSGVRGKGLAQAKTMRAALRQQWQRLRVAQEETKKGGEDEKSAADGQTSVQQTTTSVVSEETLRKTRARSDSSAVARGGAHQLSSPPPGHLAAAASLGAWSGGSLLAQLRVPALAAVDREQWSQQGGAAAAVRPTDVDIKQLQRQSMGVSIGAGGSSTGMRSTAVGVHAGGGAAGTAGSGTGGAGSGTASWTLGAWGVV